MPPLDPWQILQALGKGWLWCLAIFGAGCVVAVVIAAILSRPESEP